MIAGIAGAVSSAVAAIVMIAGLIIGPPPWSVDIRGFRLQLDPKSAAAIRGWDTIGQIEIPAYRIALLSKRLPPAHGWDGQVTTEK
jgi:hypothetical protein